MSQIDTTKTWVAGDSVTAAGMNNIIDQATALTGLISEQTPDDTPTPSSDYVMYYDPSGTPSLKRCRMDKLPAGVTSVGMTVLPTAVFSLTGQNPIDTAHPTGTLALGLKAQAKNTFLVGPVSGGNATPSFRALAPSDTAGVIDIAAATIDCTLGNVFSKGLTANAHFKLNNGVAGQRITVYLKQQGAAANFTVDWATDDTLGIIRWPRTATSGIYGQPHTMTVGNVGRSDVVNFLCTEPGLYWGTFDKDFVQQAP